LQYLLLLACPISMGAMMWMMMRGSGQRPTPSADDGRIRMLEQELRELREGRDADTLRERETSASHR
jgi:hypothetical protein